jgi:hypothetical protein
MTALTRDQIVSTLGDVEDVVVLEILATGATAEELGEARSWLANDEAPINAGDPLASGRVARLIGILETLEAGLTGDPDA